MALWDDIQKHLEGHAIKLTQFPRSQLAPAIEKTGAAISKAYVALTPTKQVLKEEMERFNVETIGPVIVAMGKKAGKARDHLRPVVEGLSEEFDKRFGVSTLGLNLRALSDRIQPYFAKVATRHSVLILLCLFPGIARMPLVWILQVLGWGIKGPRGGSTASRLNSSSGDVQARGPYATVQSASMGGYGVGVINALVRLLSASIFMWEVYDYFQSK